MATKLSEQLQTVSGITWVDMYDRNAAGAAAKTLSEMVESDWVNIGGFREGTFNLTGDEQTITEHKYENGQTIVSTTKDGTYGIEGNMPNVAAPICSKLLKMKSISSLDFTGMFRGATVYGYGDEVATIDNLMLRFRFEQGYWDYLVFPKFSLSCRFNGAGSSEELFDLAVQGSASKSDDADTDGQIYLLIKNVDENAALLVETQEASDVESTTATLEGKVSKVNVAAVISSKGFEYKKESDGSYTQVAVTGAGLTYTKNLTALTAATKYLFRAYAVADSKTYYGEVLEFTTNIA